MDKKKDSYYSCDRLEMLDLIPEKIKTTIEFGCSNGIFSRAIKEKLATESWGVDIDVEATKKATKILDKVILGDAFEVLEILPRDYFDCVICNDFLEHIINPKDFLIALKPHLKNNAYLVCSLPNVRYWKNIAELIFKKDWRYRESGILDYTHLRFFTEKSMKRLIQESGLKIERMKGLHPEKSLIFLIPNLLIMGAHNDMKYLQFGIVARYH